MTQLGAVPAGLRLDGGRALVVGGYGGLGAVICRLFAEHGAAVAVAGRSTTKATALAAQLSRAGAAAMGCRLDIVDRSSVEEAVAQVNDAWSGIDILVNCASRLVIENAEDLAEQDWHAVMDANLTGAFRLSQAVGRLMISAGGGRIIHLSSVRSVAGGRRGFAAYGASKAGLNLLVKQLATEWGSRGITVNGVAPGFVPTDFVRGGAHDQRFAEMVRARAPLGRLAEPQDIAGAVLYLASPLARFITGQILFVDGGVTASQ